MLVEIFDHDRGLGNDLFARVILQQGDLGGGPHGRISRPCRGVAEIDHGRGKRRSGLIQRDQHLMAVGRERVGVKRKAHGWFLEAAVVNEV